MKLKEQLQHYINLCINFHKFVDCKDSNSFVFLDSETLKTEIGKCYNIFRIAEYDLENEKVILQKVNDADVIANIQDLSGLNFFSNLFKINKSSDLKKLENLISNNIRIIDINELDNYICLLTSENLIYNLKKNFKIEDEVLFQEIAEFLLKNSKKYEFLENFQNSNLTFYIKLILFNLYKVNKFYNFQDQKIYEETIEHVNLLSII